jgi:hypothetical protein
MKAITTQNLTRNSTAREVIIMNFISNIMIKDNDIKKSNVENKRINSNRDYGLCLYNALEFSKDKSSKTSYNQQFEMICNRLV